MDGKTTRWASLASMRALLGLVMMLGVLSMQAGRGTLAYFTSTAASTGNTFTAGTVTLKLTDTNQVALDTIDSSVMGSNMKPGDTAVGWVTVNNTGTLPFDYGLKYTATNTTGTFWAVGSPPTLQVYTAPNTGACTLAGLGSLTSISPATPVSLTANTEIFNSGAVSKRPVAAGASEILCFAVNWPNGAAGAENVQQGAAGAIAFNFDARQ